MNALYAAPSIGAGIDVTALKSYITNQSVSNYAAPQIILSCQIRAGRQA